MQPKSRKKLQLTCETVRVLERGALEKIVGGISRATMCQSKDLVCPDPTGGVTCDSVDVICPTGNHGTC